MIEERRIDDWLLVWGNRDFHYQALSARYPYLKLCRTKQVHKDNLVFVTSDYIDNSCEGDGMITQERNLALCSITADCAPCLLFCAKSKLTGAAHAGWRGVAGQIIPKLIKNLVDLGAQAESLHVFIGPHIQQSSFEVHHDVSIQLLASIGLTRKTCSSDFLAPKNESKDLVSLSNILKTQISLSGVPDSNIWIHQDDTMTNSSYHSARRDRAAAGRQISFIARI